MKKMNKMYEAPKAETIEMQMPVVLMASAPASPGTGGNQNPLIFPDDD